PLFFRRSRTDATAGKRGAPAFSVLEPLQVPLTTSSRKNSNFVGGCLAQAFARAIVVGWGD
ncbi:MAG: hypothetical protein WD733_15740, partial [Bryobacterales bacterium]